MSHTVVLFHSAQGLRPAVNEFADDLRASGHHVHTPDLFDGATFDVLADGIRLRDEIGIQELGRRAMAAVEHLGSDVVYAGFSMGAASAEFLGTARPGAKALVLLHGVVPPQYLGVEAWPGIPVQVHSGTNDSWAPRAEIEEFASFVRAAGAPCEVHWYDVPGHLFTDAGNEEYDAAATALILERLKTFLARVDAP